MSAQSFSRHGPQKARISRYILHSLFENKKKISIQTSFSGKKVTPSSNYETILLESKICGKFNTFKPLIS